MKKYKKELATTRLSECVWFKRRKRNVNFYTIIDNGDVLEPRLSDLNSEGLCIFEDTETLIDFLKKRLHIVDIPKKVGKQLIVFKDAEIEAKRNWFVSLEKAFVAEQDTTFSIKELNKLLRQNEQLSLM